MLSKTDYELNHLKGNLDIKGGSAATIILGCLNLNRDYTTRPLADVDPHWYCFAGARDHLGDNKDIISAVGLAQINIV